MGMYIYNRYIRTCEATSLVILVTIQVFSPSAPFFQRLWAHQYARYLIPFQLVNLLANDVRSI